ncbi:MAG: hypothetical protein ACRDSP_17710 [Pseudonocardiaceae bacterium]
MIGGRVLDTTALLTFARGTSVYAAAAIWTAVEESIVLIVPSTAVAAALTDLAVEPHPVFDVLLHLPVTVIDNLDEARARAISQLGGHQADAHAVACALDRGWPLITANPTHYARYEQTGVTLEPLP